MNDPAELKECLKMMRHVSERRGRLFGMADEFFSVSETAFVQKWPRFDPTKRRAVSWAYSVAQSAISDYLREIDPMSRRDRKAKKAGAEMGSHMSSNGRRIFREDRSIVSLEAAFDTSTPPVRYDDYDLEKVIARLRPKEAQVIRGYYYEGKRLYVIGAEMGISEARVSQILRATLKKLREMYPRSL